jgi:hypothetical protein
MKFVCILGDSAVGKMTVGQKLEALTGFSLFHNHMTIELVLDVFKSFHIPAIEALRFTIFEEFVKTDLPGLILTLQLPFDIQEEVLYLESLIDYFESRDVESYIVELDATLEERLHRNKTENRLKHKASKRDLEISERRLLNASNKYRFISKPGEVKHPRFLQIDNTNKSAEEVARMICDYFKF